MDQQICVHCRNKKTINSTTNRLVTESCGHVKCMDCLINEKSGCSACKETNGIEIKIKPEKPLLGIEIKLKPEKPLVEADSGVTALDTVAVELEKPQVTVKLVPKPDTSHILVETDATGKHYYCTLCKRKFRARSQIEHHAYCGSSKKPYQCPECDKGFSTHSHFKYHMRAHRNERTYSCEICGDSFLQMSKLQRHKLKHTNEKRFSCAECNKGFTSLASLRLHRRTHTQERPYECHLCARTFRDASNCRRHLLLHQVNKCTCNTPESQTAPDQTAGKITARGDDKMAERVDKMAAGGDKMAARAARGRCAVHGARAHACPRCPQAFRANKDMRRHLAVHTDWKPYRCKVCNRHFRRKDNLERHIRNTHPDFEISNAVECDIAALKQITSVNKTETTQKLPEKAYQTYQKTKLETLNPLPPLSKEVIEKHLQENGIDQSKIEDKNDDDVTQKEKQIEPPTDKSYILAANNARESVIFGPIRRESIIDRKSPVQEIEYVHKIRKALDMTTPKNVKFPPANENNIAIILTEDKCLNKIDGKVGPPKNLELYKKILCSSNNDDDNGEMPHANTSREMHWKKNLCTL